MTEQIKPKAFEKLREIPTVEELLSYKSFKDSVLTASTNIRIRANALTILGIHCQLETLSILKEMRDLLQEHKPKKTLKKDKKD